LVERRENGYFQYLKTGHFYFGKKRTFLFWLDNREKFY